MMSVAETIPKPLTAEVLIDLPDDGVDRELIRGELRERPMTYRNRDHSGIEATIAWALRDWLMRQPTPRGRIHSGEAGFRLSREPETFVGIDVAYASAELVQSSDPHLKFYDGAPVLAVEILSPSDRHEDVVEKVRLYLEVGSVVWVVDPDFRTVSVHQPGQSVAVYTERQELSGGEYLPGFSLPVGKFFEI